MMCRCLRVSRSGCCAWAGRRPSGPARRRKELSALIEWVFNSSHGTYGYRRVHAAGARRGVETSPDTVRARHALPGPARPHSHAERTRRHRPGRRARARAPTWSGAGSRRLAGSEVGGRHPLVPAPGEGPDLPGDRCRAAAPGRWSGTRLGRQHAAPTPLCEAIDMAARRRPHTTGGETVFHSDRGCQYTSDPSSSPST